MHTAHQLLVIQRASLPIIVKAADGSTFEVTAEAGDLKENEYFWVALGLKVNRWQGEELKEEHFGAITKEQLSLLKTGSAILPGLINKQEYKGYLTMVKGNVEHLQGTMKEDLKKADQKDPLTSPKSLFRRFF
ncbi:MAG: hypothetical protein ASARMPREDX12_001339 [Alectoria sarmentosa]|nr:MAG: hypothetical protein ASARMPREDX12_001339 [Alectoria sarmentosa]